MTPVRPGMAEVIADRRIVICAGPGGVGKTTAAAAIALEAARRGRRACVVTIDPARRLADALGLGELGNQPHQVKSTWEGPGELWALMLDTKATFDDVVTANASSPEQVAAILANRFYRNISGALSGTQEYMAIEKLYALHQDRRFEVVVVDTPPTRHALDFLDAPGRLTRFLNNRFFRVLMSPTRVGLRAVNVATQMLLRTFSRVVGNEVVRDAIAFFTAFEGMEQGFRDRSARMTEMFLDPGTAFVVVAAARRDAVEEASYFADRLRETEIPVAALVVNRVLPHFGDVGPQPTDALADLWTNLADLDGIARREEHHIASLVERLPDTPVVRVPFLAAEVHDMAGLDQVGRALVGG